VACVVMLATIRPVRVEMVAADVAPPACPLAPARPPRHDRSARLSVVDVAAGVAPAALVNMVGLQASERVIAINDQSLDDDLDADLLIRSLARPGGFLDLTVSSTGSERRVLVLMH
jgi:hypothetical protein